MSRTLSHLSLCLFLTLVFLQVQTNLAYSFWDDNASFRVKPQNAASQQNSAPAAKNLAENNAAPSQAPLNRPMGSAPAASNSANTPAWYNRTQGFFANPGDTPTATSAPAYPATPVLAAPIEPIPSFKGPKFSDSVPAAPNLPNWNPPAPNLTNWNPPAKNLPDAASRNFSSMPLTPPTDYSAATAPSPQNYDPSLRQPQRQDSRPDFYSNAQRQPQPRAMAEEPIRTQPQIAPVNSYPNLSSVPAQRPQNNTANDWSQKLQADHAAAQQTMQQEWAQTQYSNEYFQEYPVAPTPQMATEQPASWPSQAMTAPQAQAAPVQMPAPARQAQTTTTQTVTKTVSTVPSNAPDTQNWPKTPVYVMEGANANTATTLSNNFEAAPLVPPSAPMNNNASNELAWSNATAPSQPQQPASQSPSIISYGNVYVTTGDQYARQPSTADAVSTAPSFAATPQAWVSPNTPAAQTPTASLTPATPYLNPRDLSLVMPAEGTPAPAIAAPQPFYGTAGYYAPAGNSLYGVPLQPPVNGYADMQSMNAQPSFVAPAPGFTPMPQRFGWSDMTASNGLVPPAEITGASPWTQSGGAMQAYTDRMMQSAPYTSGTGGYASNTGAPYYPYGYSGFGNWHRTQIASNSATLPSGTGNYPSPVGGFDINKPVATLYFQGDNANLGGDEVKVLQQLTDWFQGKGGGLRVVGHSSQRTANMDPAKQRMRNYRLSLDRADNVAKRLEKLGVPQNKMVVSAHGDTEQASVESMPAGEAWNRRVEIYWDMM